VNIVCWSLFGAKPFSDAETHFVVWGKFFARLPVETRQNGYQ
jgi:hypothetical protein